MVIEEVVVTAAATTVEAATMVVIGGAAAILVGIEVDTAEVTDQATIEKGEIEMEDMGKQILF